MTTVSNDDFSKSLDGICQHIDGIEQDRQYIELKLLEPFLKGIAYEELGKIVQQAPNFAKYKWQEFEEDWEPPKLRKKNATPEEIAEYQQKRYSESLGYQIAACIARHAYFYRNIRGAMDRDIYLNKLTPYMQVHIDGEVPESFPFKDEELINPNDSRLETLRLQVSPNIPSIRFSRHRTKEPINRSKPTSALSNPSSTFKIQVKKPDSDKDKLPSSVRIFGYSFIGFALLLIIAGIAKVAFLNKSEAPAPITVQPTPSETQGKSIAILSETQGKSVSLSTSAPTAIATPTPTPTKLIPQGETPASEMNPELAKSLYTIINSKYICIKITSSKLIAKDATGITVNLTCDYQDRYNLIILNKKPPTYQIYALTPDGRFN